VRLLGVRLVGLTPENGAKLLLTLAAIAAAWVAGRAFRAAARALLRGRNDVRARFWSGQAIHLALTALLLLFLVSVWFDQPGRIVLAGGMVAAGLAVALRRVITAVSGYFVILSSRVFTVGDRIGIGEVRGDVVALGFTRTTLMEMGQPQPLDRKEPAIWVGGRQYTGRVVTVTNDRIFTDPVFNYTREFPFLWEEIRVPVPYRDDADAAERILLDAVRRHAVKLEEIGVEAQEELKRRYAVAGPELEPRVFRRITSSWLEVTVRFITRDHGIRELKDAVTRDVLAEFRRSGIEVASATVDVVGLPRLAIRRAGRGAEG